MSTLSFSTIKSHTFVSHLIYYTLGCSPFSIHSITIYQGALCVWLNVQHRRTEIRLNGNNGKEALNVSFVYYYYYYEMI